jgi:hypothetical protein
VKPEQDEFVARSMDRLWATATTGAQPDRPTRQTVITDTKSGVSVAFTLADTRAIFDEFDLDAPCGICHQARCRRRDDA